MAKQEPLEDSTPLLQDNDRNSDLSTVDNPCTNYKRKTSKTKVFTPGSLTQSFRGSSSREGPDDWKEILQELLQRGESQFTQMSVQKVLKTFKTNMKTGLNKMVAQTTLEQVGKNALEVKANDPLWLIFFNQFADLLVVLLIVSAVVAFALGQPAAASCIVIIIVANAILGTLMEYSAGNAMTELLNSSPPLVQVIRDSMIQEIPSENLVPGDIVIIQAGKIVPADIRLISASKLVANEAPLTGEANPIKKCPEADKQILRDGKKNVEKTGKDGEEEILHPNMVYMGCEILSGSATGVVIFTGMKTHMGHVANLLSSTDSNVSPLEIKLQKLGVQLGIASLLISIVVFVVGVTLNRGGDPNTPDQPIALQMLLVAVSLTVAAVPEGLPACVTISLASGMRSMSKKNAIIKKMKSVETLGSATVVCTDKTGTLTTGVMTVKRMWIPTKRETLKITGEGYNPEGSFLPDNVEVTSANKEKVIEKYAKNDGVFVTALVNALLCCDDKTRLQRTEEGTWECLGNMSERPLVVAAAKMGIKREDINRQFSTIMVNPFENQRKMMSTVVHVKTANQYFEDAEFIICVKGAPDQLLIRCNKMLIWESEKRVEKDITEEVRKEIEEQINLFSEQAYRVLAVAYRRTDGKVKNATEDEIEQKLVLSGLFASIDPARHGVDSSIEQAANAGVRTIMITGDYIKTARAIAQNIRLLQKDSTSEKSRDCKCIRDAGSEEQQLLELNKSKGGKKKKLGNQAKDHYLNTEEKKQLKKIQSQIDEITRITDVFARAKPIDKITIVRSLLRQGHIASMTGDGVNDAPALKQASIGIAMGITGTDVAKSASDMILADDNFCSIIAAIKEGRTIYANIGKFCFFLLSTNIAEVFAVMIAVLIGYPSPLVPTQILWLNLTTDGFPAISLAVESSEPGIMEEGPKPAKEPLIEKVMKTGIVIQTFVLTSIVLGSYMLTWKWNSGSWDPFFTDDNEIKGEVAMRATTVTIIVFVFAELFRAYTSRSMRRSICTVGVFTNKYMQYSVIGGIITTVIVTTVPPLNKIFGCTQLSLQEWGFAVSVSFIPAIIDELTKLLYRLTGFGERKKNF